MADKIVMTALSPTMEMGTIIEWKVKEGDRVKTEDLLCEVETDKASMELTSPASGIILKIIKDKGSQAHVGDIIGAIGKEGEDVGAIIAEAMRTPHVDSVPVVSEPVVAVALPQPAVALPQPIVNLPVIPSESSDRLKASPLARRIATLKGIDLNYVQGTGPQRRIVLRDLENERVPLSSLAKRKGGEVAVGGSSLNSDFIPLTGKRKVIAQRLKESKNSAPHFYLMTSIIMDDLLASREALNKTRQEGKVSINAFLIKILAQVITRHQTINSSWTEEGVQNHATVAVGLAVAQPDGLITPIVQSCEQKGVLKIDSELNDLIARARTNKLKPEEYTGATFTISSLGSMGIEQFTSIINPPGVAILAIGSIKKEVVVGPHEEILIKSLMKVTLSCDHRVVDGAVAARFLKDVRNTLENPIMALY